MRCEPGDLAVVIGSMTAANNGHLVEVIERHVELTGRLGFEVWWRCRSHAPMLTSKGRMTTVGSLPDAGLYPIRPGTEGEVADLLRDLEFST